MEQKEALKIMLSGKNCFLTGDAGTGKTWVTKEFIEKTRKKGKNVVVVAPTGIAAINIGGATIHSTFKMYGTYAKDRPMRAQSVDWDSIHSLIIDEISMVGPDYLDHIDMILKKSRISKKPFGGIQVILVGDEAQLPPVYTENNDQEREELDILKKRYGTLTFRSAQSFSKFEELCMTEVKRQNDPHFISLLNDIRIGDISALYKFKKGKGTEDSVHLKPYNNMVDMHNQKEFNRLKGSEKAYKGQLSGDFKESNCMSPINLKLKEGARIMVTKNMQNGLVNGDMGTVVKLSGSSVIINSDRFKQRFELSYEEWKEVIYEGHEEKIIGTYVQIPLKLAWAITIHKSQGLSLDHVCLSYVPKMSKELLYVGLSRCTSYDNLYINM